MDIIRGLLVNSFWIAYNDGYHRTRLTLRRTFNDFTQVTDVKKIGFIINIGNITQTHYILCKFYCLWIIFELQWSMKIFPIWLCIVKYCFMYYATYSILWWPKMLLKHHLVQQFWQWPLSWHRFLQVPFNQSIISVDKSHHNEYHKVWTFIQLQSFSVKAHSRRSIYPV